MRRIWAVCRHTLIECLRARVTGVFLLVLAGGIVLLPLVARATDLRSQVQTFLAYSISVSMLVLSVLTILLGCGLLAREIENRNIFVPLTKPVARWQYVLGRWLGIVVGQMVLLAVVGGVIYGTTYYLRRQATNDAVRKELDEQVLCARVRRGLTEFDDRLDELMKRRVEELRSAKQGEDPFAEARAAGPKAEQALERDIRRWATTRLQTAAPGRWKRWTFTGLDRPTDKDATIQFRFQANAAEEPPDGKLLCDWEFRNTTPIQADNADGGAAGKDQGDAGPAEPPKPRYMGMRQQAVSMLVDVPKTLTLPAMLISDDGELEVSFHNLSRMPVTIDHREMFVLYPAGGFAMNFLRGLLLVLCLQVFLAAFAVLASSWLSFPVAALACFVFFVIGLTASFVSESTKLGPKSDASTYVGHYTAEVVLTALPDFQAANPAADFVDGTRIAWRRIGVEALLSVALKSGLALGLACVIFSLRELARVTA